MHPPDAPCSLGTPNPWRSSPQPGPVRPSSSDPSAVVIVILVDGPVLSTAPAVLLAELAPQAAEPDRATQRVRWRVARRVGEQL